MQPHLQLLLCQFHLSSHSGPSQCNSYLLSLGLPEQVAAAAVNPGFFDPYDVDADVTLDNPGL